MNSVARVRATSYITRTGPRGLELLVFTYPTAPETGTHLPGGGVEPGERPDHAAIREAREEAGVQGDLILKGVVGVQQGRYDTGGQFTSIYFHLATNDARASWTHTMIGDQGVWDTGLPVHCHFATLSEAAQLLNTSLHRQEQYLDALPVAAEGCEWRGQADHR